MPSAPLTKSARPALFFRLGLFFGLLSTVAISAIWIRSRTVQEELAFENASYDPQPAPEFKGDYIGCFPGALYWFDGRRSNAGTERFDPTQITPRIEYRRNRMIEGFHLYQLTQDTGVNFYLNNDNTNHFGFAMRVAASPNNAYAVRLIIVPIYTLFLTAAIPTALLAIRIRKKRVLAGFTVSSRSQ